MRLRRHLSLWHTGRLWDMAVKCRGKSSRRTRRVCNPAAGGVMVCNKAATCGIASSEAEFETLMSAFVLARGCSDCATFVVMDV